MTTRGTQSFDAMALYYDDDFPARAPTSFPCEWGAITSNVDGRDVDYFIATAGETVLEIGAGTGRVALPLARAGHTVVALDSSVEMLLRLEQKLEQDSCDVRKRIRVICADALSVELTEQFDSVILAFNSIASMPSGAAQRNLLQRVSKWLRVGGRFHCENLNPLPVAASDNTGVPRLLYTRQSSRGTLYSRFQVNGPPNDDHVQRLVGWYDEILHDGRVKRTPYALEQRPVPLPEMLLMLELSGLNVLSVNGGFGGEPYRFWSRSYVITADRKE